MCDPTPPPDSPFRLMCTVHPVTLGGWTHLAETCTSGVRAGSLPVVTELYIPQGGSSGDGLVECLALPASELAKSGEVLTHTLARQQKLGTKGECLCHPRS